MKSFQRWIGISLVVMVPAQPIFGFRTIPEFFHYSTIAALLLGALDGIALCGGVLLIVSTLYEDHTPS